MVARLRGRRLLASLAVAWAADPEALLLFTLQIARDDARLFDEVLDWLAVNAGVMSVRRLRNFYLGDSRDERLGEAALAWIAENGTRVHAAPLPRRRWAEELVFDQSRTPKRPNRSFLGFGLLKPPTKRSGKSRPPELGESIALAFRLRRVFGVGSRAEVARFLITAGTASPNGSRPLCTTLAVAEAAGYAKRNVQEALSGLVDAGLVQRVVRGNEHLYRAELERWLPLLPSPEARPAYRDWPNAFTAFREVHRWLATPDLPNLSPYMLASEARRLMSGMEQSFAHAGLPVSGRDAPGAEYWDVFVDEVQAAIGGLDSGLPW